MKRNPCRIVPCRASPHWHGKRAPAMAIVTPWAIGVNARYVIGIWTGRPDGTPVVGQFGFASAVPLLNQVNNILLSRSANLPEDPRPNSVTRGVICWPGGQSLPEGDGNCRRRSATWLLDGSQPPTLLLPEQEGINGIRFPIWLDENGKRVAADCPQARQEMINVWPLPLEPLAARIRTSRCALTTGLDNLPAIRSRCQAPSAADRRSRWRDY